MPLCARIGQALEKLFHGQQKAKQALAHAVSIHQRQLASLKANHSVSGRLAASNLALLGPPGTGKTALATTAASLSGLPWLHKSLVEYSAPGFPGKQLETCVQELCEGGAISSGGGIVVLDGLESCLPRAGSDERSQLKQLDLASLIRGRAVRVNRGGTLQFFDSNRILWVLTAGEFSEFKRLAGAAERAIGFGRSPASSDSHASLSREGLLKWGLCPALTDAIARFVATEELSAFDLAAVCQLPHSPIEHAKALLAEAGVELEFAPHAIAVVAALAEGRQCGVHGLHQVLHEVVSRLMSTLPAKACSVCVTAEFVLGAGAAVVGEARTRKPSAPSSLASVSSPRRAESFKRPARSNASSASGEGRLASALDLKKWTLHP